METIKNRDRILEAIDQLRRRKARPDIQRICNYLFRKFSISSSEARTDLQWCVDRGIVLKVEYKGSISYRNAAKKFSLHLKQQRDTGIDISAIDNNIKANRKFAQLLTNAFGELVVQEPDYLEFGVPAVQIINHILAKDSVRYTKKYISILIEKEVDNGGLIKMENDHYLMGPTKEELPSHHKNENEYRLNVNGEQVMQKVKKKPGPKPGYKRLQALHDSDEKRMDNGSLRVGGRRKRAKKVFDPSDTHIPRKRGRPAGSLNKSTIEKQIAKSSDDSRPESRASNSGREPGGVCSVCHLQIHLKKGPNDRMVACKECSNKAHFSCLNSGDDMMLKIYPDSSWQCPHCKTCVVCYETADAGIMVVCAICADAYHTNCHHPKISDKIKPNSRWLCINCEMPQELKLNEIQSNMTNMSNSYGHKIICLDNDDNSSSPPLSGNSTPYQSPPLSPTPPQLSPQMDNELNQQNGSLSDSLSNRDSDDDNIDPSIPDASNWSVEDVYQYFFKYFPEEAHIFREQDIDGRSLLLLRRMDVLTNLRLKLGPALKIYRHVVKLQVRRDDPKFYWL